MTKPADLLFHLFAGGRTCLLFKKSSPLLYKHIVKVIISISEPSVYRFGLVAIFVQRACFVIKRVEEPAHQVS